MKSTVQRVILLATTFWAPVDAMSKAAKKQKEPCSLPFDIYGKPEVFSPSNYIDVNNQCEYTATIKLNLADAGMPFPTNPPQDCDLASTACNGVSCLLEVRNVYRLGKKFEDSTGFNHIGIDWSPCGHPPLDKFGRPHYNIHIFRVTPEERQAACCVMDGPIICAQLAEQTYSNGRKFFVWGMDSDGKIANVPATYSAPTDTAVPGVGLHAYDANAAQNVADWDKPILIEGLYGGE